MMEMTREMAIGKIHRAVVTGADLHYVGSITVDEDLLDAANIVPGQKVDIVAVNTGEDVYKRQIQYVDIYQGPVLRFMGIATIKLSTASAHTDAKLEGVPVDEAARLRDVLAQRGSAELMGL